MSTLQNAIASITLGIEDFGKDDPKRAVGAIRHFYAGVLLLGKACLLSRVPTADPRLVLASRHRLVPDENGDIRFEPRDQKTIDVAELEQRFKDFGFTWVKGEAKAAFSLLRQMRNAIEHFEHVYSQNEIRAAVGACFPIVAKFFELMDEKPADHLAHAWDFMLDQQAFYDKLVEECQASLKSLPWSMHLDLESPAACKKCGLSLLRQRDPQNDDPSLIDPFCVSCGTTYGTTEFIEAVIVHAFYTDAYISMTQGGEPPWLECDKCNDETFVTSIDEPLCFSCGYKPHENCRVCDLLQVPGVTAALDGDLCQSCWEDTFMDQ